MKKLAKADFEGQKPDLQRSLKFEIGPGIIPDFVTEFTWTILEHSIDFEHYYLSPRSSIHPSGIFHPPTALV